MAGGWLEPTLVYGLVTICAGYSLHRLLPRALKARMATGLVMRLTGRSDASPPAAWRVRAARAIDRYAASQGGGCGGCGDCPPTAGQRQPEAGSPKAQPIRWLPRNKR